MSMIGDAYRRVTTWIDPWWIPGQNRRLAQRAAVSPESLVLGVDQAIERAVDYFEPQKDLEISAMTSLWGAYLSGLEPRLAFILERVRRCCEEYNSPHFRFFDRTYDPESPEALARQQIPVAWLPIEGLMVRSLYADRFDLDESFLNELAPIDDGGSYGTTHIAIACLLLREFSTISREAIGRQLDATIAPMVRAQRNARSGDIFAERIMVLHWMGRHAEVEAAWILRLLDAQLDDGGWSGGPSIRSAVSNQHTTAAALVALLHDRASRLSGTNDASPNGFCPEGALR